jgi:drug/metabolite transporter (DMT)-like permease
MERMLESPMTRRLGLALGTIYLVWGSTYLAIRVAVRTMPPFLMASVRFLVAGAVLYAWAARRGEAKGDRIGWPQWRAATVVGGLLLLGGNGSVVWAEQRVPSGITALIIATIPIWFALIAAAFGERRQWSRTVAGLALGLAGTALLVRAGGARGGSVDAVGVVVLVFAAIAWALGSVVSPHLPLPRRPLVATAMEMLAGGALLGILGLATGEGGHIDWSGISFTSVMALAYLIVFGSLVAFSAYVWLLQNASTSVVSTYAYVNPVIAVLLGWWLLHERVTGLTLLAAAVIVSAVALIVLGQQPRGVRARVGSADAPAPD